MTDRRGYSFPSSDLDRASRWPSDAQHAPRYPAPSNYQGAPPTTYAPMSAAQMSGSAQYGVDNYPAGFSPSMPSQYMATTHQSRQTYPSASHPHQAPSAVPQYSVPSQQYSAHLSYPTSHQQSSIHHTSPYYGRESQYQQPQYPASPSRPFSCDLCALSFNRQHDLKRHRETHSGEKPFLCNGGCGKTFTRKDALKRHQLVKHCGHEEDVS